MINRLTTQATAFGLATLATVAVLASLNALAHDQRADAAGPAIVQAAAAADAPVHQVVITARRLSRA